MGEQSSRQGVDEALIDNPLVWREPTSARTVSAVALIIHGLNVNPLRMDALVHELNSWGVAPLRCTLSGHANRLPIDRESVGDTVWRLMMAQMRSHLGL